MSEPGSQSDPSMDEILASIRRIIAEEEEPDQAGAGTAATPRPVAQPTPEAVPELVPEGEDEVLELTEELGAAGDEDGDEDDDENVLTLTTLAGGEESEIFEAETLEGEDEIDETLEEELDASPLAAPHASDAGEDGAGDEEEAPISEAELVEEAPAPAETGHLMSEETERRALDALRAAMAEAPPPPEETQQSSPPPSPQPSEEDLRVVMAPMVREWLDANLPELVERVVREEVARLVTRGRDS